MPRWATASASLASIFSPTWRCAQYSTSRSLNNNCHRAMDPDFARALPVLLLVLQVVRSASISEHFKPIQSYTEPRNVSAEWSRDQALDLTQRAIMFETGRTVEAENCSFPEDPAVNFGLDQAFGSSTLSTVFIEVPRTPFTCQHRATGYYADKDGRTACRVFHYCNNGENVISFICPSCTLFHEEKQLCDYWYNVECNASDEDDR